MPSSSPFEFRQDQELIAERVARLSSLGTDQQDEARRISEEIEYLSLDQGRLGGRVASVPLTLVVAYDESGIPKGLEPAVPYDDDNPVHRVIRAKGFEWPDNGPINNI